MLQVLNDMKTGKALSPLQVSLELIAAKGGVGIQAKTEICQRGLDRFGMPVEWPLRIVVPIFKGKGDIRYCSYYGAVKLLEHGMKVVENVLERSFHRKVTVNEMQFDSKPERETIDAVSILKMQQEEYHAKDCICAL